MRPVKSHTRLLSISLCTFPCALSCWKRERPLLTCSHKVGSMEFHALNLVGTAWNGPLPLSTWLCTSRQNKVHNEMDESPVQSPYPKLTIIPLWINLERGTLNQPSSNIRVWPHQRAFGKMIQHSLKDTDQSYSQKSWSCNNYKRWTGIILNPMG